MGEELRSPDSGVPNLAGADRPQKGVADDVWRQAVSLRDVLRDEETRTQQRRAAAEVARREAEEQVLEATREVCDQIRSRAEKELHLAETARSEADRVLAAARAEAARLKAEADEKLKHAEEARSAVDTAIIEAQREANDIRDKMRNEASEDIRAMLADIEALRSAAQQEIETQRIITETARIRAVAPKTSTQRVDFDLTSMGPLNLVSGNRPSDEPDAGADAEDTAEPSEARSKSRRSASAEGTASGKRRARGKSAA